MLPRVCVVVTRSFSFLKFYTGNASLSLFLLSILLHIDISSFILLPPLLLLLLTGPRSNLASPHSLTANLSRIIPLFCRYVLYAGILAIISTSITGGTHWIPQTWGATYDFLLFTRGARLNLIAA